MKKQVSPVVAIVIILIALAGVGAYIYKGSQGVNTGPGKLESNLDSSKMESDPIKFEAAIKASLEKEKQRSGK